MESGDSGDKSSSGRGRGFHTRERKQLRRPFTTSNSTTSLADTHTQSPDHSSGLTTSQQDNSTSPALGRDLASGQGGVMSSSLSPFAKEFYPSNWHQEKIEKNDEFEDADGIIHSFPLQKLTAFVYEVTESPARFEASVETLTDTLNGSGLDGNMLGMIVSTIMDQAIMEQNFRYNAARLCNYLSQNLSITTKDGTFRQLLLKRCEDEQSKRESLVSTDEGMQYLRGLTMFIAELFVHIDVDVEGHKRRVFTLGQSLTQLLETLLSVPTPDNLKCVSQVLKLSGALIEDYEKTKQVKPEESPSAPEMEKIITRIKNLVSDQEISRNARDMLAKVVELRSCNWGRVSSSPVTSNDTLIGNDCGNEPVLYGPDGTPISAEEECFLTHYHYGTNDIGFDNDNGEEEMDEEMAVAYEEFLRESGQ